MYESRLYPIARNNSGISTVSMPRGAVVETAEWTYAGPAIRANAKPDDRMIRRKVLCLRADAAGGTGVVRIWDRTVAGAFGISARGIRPTFIARLECPATGTAHLIYILPQRETEE